MDRVTKAYTQKQWELHLFAHTKNAITMAESNNATGAVIAAIIKTIGPAVLMKHIQIHCLKESIQEVERNKEIVANSTAPGRIALDSQWQRSAWVMDQVTTEMDKIWLPNKK